MKSLTNAASTVIAIGVTTSIIVIVISIISIAAPVSIFLRT